MRDNAADAAAMSEVIDVRIAPKRRLVLSRAAREALGVTGAGLVVHVCVTGPVWRLRSVKACRLSPPIGTGRDLPSRVSLSS